MRMPSMVTAFPAHALPGVLAALALGAALPATANTVSGETVAWHPITVSFAGPAASEGDVDPNPFLDYRLTVRFTGPSGQAYDVPGFFDGDGNGGGSGDVYRVRFAADEGGRWSYAASFRAGKNVAVDLSPTAGTAAAFDGTSGTMDVAPRDDSAPGFLRLGRLEYVGGHYLKFADGPYWLKGGVDSPENLLGYAGFDNTVDQGGAIPDFLHRFDTHRADWVAGDPDFVSADTGEDGRGLIGALNYLASERVNSVYFLPMNLGGDGQDSYPFISPDNSPEAKLHYDLSKLAQWNRVFDHAQRRGIALHVVLAETEAANENWFDNGALGTERKLFYRELIARFGYVLAGKWNLCEENDFATDRLREFAGFIRALDWTEKPVAVHTFPNNFRDYEVLVGDPLFQATSIQYDPPLAGAHVERWRELSAATGVPWVVDMDENNPFRIGVTDTNAEQLRKEILYDVYFSGGNVEWFFGLHDLPLGGDVNTEDFRTREQMYRFTWHARAFIQEHLPFWEMAPADALLTGESDSLGGGEAFALGGEVYAVYLPEASPSGSLDLSGVSGDFEQRWYNPATGAFAGDAIPVTAGAPVALGTPPSRTDEDWVVLLSRPAAEPPPAPPPDTGGGGGGAVIWLLLLSLTAVPRVRRGRAVRAAPCPSAVESSSSTA